MPNKREEMLAVFKDLLGVNVTLLRFMGLFFMDSVFARKSKKPGVREVATIGTVFVLIILLLIFEFRTVQLNWKKDTILALNMGLWLLEKSEDIMYLLRRLAAMWDASIERRRNENEILRMIRIVTAHRNGYILVIMGGVVSYFILPLTYILHQVWFTKNEYNSYNYSKTIFPILYPFPLNNAFSYFVCVHIEQIVVLYIASFWTCCDSTYAQVVTHVTVHFE
ncbi:uncharacterized protein LOC111674282, partial [Orussus abietinus]|uniref:uncharacterized protein LOC111674282 n=1 Tax=Orussus abietinus TaxID=222816 RepID=UPI000C71605C